MLYVEKRFDARRSNVSLFLSAAKELAMAGVAMVSNGGVSGGEGELIRWLTSSDGSSTTTAGVETGLSTSE
jgi:hypothetical protein